MTAPDSPAAAMVRELIDEFRGAPRPRRRWVTDAMYADALDGVLTELAEARGLLAARGGCTHLDGPLRRLQADNKRLRADLAEAREHLDAACGLIANAGMSFGGWDHESPEWVAAAERWRDRWHELLGLGVPVTEMTPAESAWHTWAMSCDVDTGGRCTCGHEGLGVDWHLGDCAGANHALRRKLLTSLDIIAHLESAERERRTIAAETSAEPLSATDPTQPGSSVSVDVGADGRAGDAGP